MRYNERRKLRVGDRVINPFVEQWTDLGTVVSIEPGLKMNIRVQLDRLNIPIGFSDWELTLVENGLDVMLRESFGD